LIAYYFYDEEASGGVVATMRNDGSDAHDRGQSNAGATNASDAPDIEVLIGSCPSLSAFFQNDREEARRDYLGWLRKKANAIVDQSAGRVDCLKKFAKVWLSDHLLFGPAARIFALARDKCEDPRTSNWLMQQWALATYKDEERPARDRLDAALAILAKIEPLKGEIDPDLILEDSAETSALRGAVHRRLYELDGQAKRLHDALTCYRTSHEIDLKREARFTGYGALNAAVLLDTLAFTLELTGDGPITGEAAGKARAESDELRTIIVDRLGRRLAAASGDHEEWLYETMAGACLALGLARWDTGANTSHEGSQASPDLLRQAASWIDKATACKRPDWKRETTHAQWLRVALLNEPSGAASAELENYWNAAAETIKLFRTKTGGVALSGHEMAGDARRGKVGLALSGGGFRASFFHIGVLARLAEVDALRHIDVLSTVSGGSIVGAHYYLLLRKLLESNPDPSRGCYIGIVKRLQKDFSAAVDANMRMRGLSNVWVALKLLFKPGYTRSDRMAELYDKLLYAPALASANDRPCAQDHPCSEDHPCADNRRCAKPADQTEAIVRPPKRPTAPQMRSLSITPAGENAGFNPRYGNWRRSARVPALLINATSLNTGHSWHFTAHWMGEPPELIGQEVDKNERLRRVYYADAGRHQSLTLGSAVAASACVPGIFEPLRLPGLYPGRLVRLVDGGVHDNQGVDALIGQGCDFILCSDASGQTGDEFNPANGPVTTPKRALNILMKRVRESEFADLNNCVKSVAGRNLFFIHLKSELPADDIDWIDCDDPTRRGPRTPTSYGIDQDIQRHISDIRTDLDSFSEVEAGALMLSGYRMTCAALKVSVARTHSRSGDAAFGAFDIRADHGSWSFLALRDAMATPPDARDIVRDDLVRQLRVGRELFFKETRLASRSAIIVASLLLFAIVSFSLVKAYCEWDAIRAWLFDADFRGSRAVVLAAAMALAVAGAWPRLRVWCFESFFAITGLVLSNVYFGFGLNRLFLKRGRLDRLLKLK